MTLEESILRCEQDFNYPDIIDSNAGLYETVELNAVGIPSWNLNNPTKKRIAVLQITTYRGISSDAMHFYAKIIADGVYVATLDNLKKPRNLTYAEEANHPLYNYKYNFVVQRPITIDDINSDPKKWVAYNVGDLTQRYNSLVELISDVKEIFKLRFVGDWDFFVKYPNGKTINIDNIGIICS